MENKEEQLHLNFEQDITSLKVYINHLCQQSVIGEKDGGHLWIAFTDKFNMFLERVKQELAK